LHITLKVHSKDNIKNNTATELFVVMPFSFEQGLKEFQAPPDPLTGALEKKRELFFVPIFEGPAKHESVSLLCY